MYVYSVIRTTIHHLYICSYIITGVSFCYSNPLFVFTGGTPVDYLTTSITLMQGKSLSILSCDSVIIDFFAIPSSPYIEGWFPVIVSLHVVAT